MTVEWLSWATLEVSRGRFEAVLGCLGMVSVILELFQAALEAHETVLKFFCDVGAVVKQINKQFVVSVV